MTDSSCSTDSGVYPESVISATFLAKSEADIGDPNSDPKALEIALFRKDESKVVFKLLLGPESVLVNGLSRAGVSAKICPMLILIPLVKPMKDHKIF